MLKQSLALIVLLSLNGDTAQPRFLDTLYHEEIYHRWTLIIDFNPYQRSLEVIAPDSKLIIGKPECNDAMKYIDELPQIVKEEIDRGDNGFTGECWQVQPRFTDLLSANETYRGWTINLDFNSITRNLKITSPQNQVITSYSWCNSEIHPQQLLELIKRLIDSQIQTGKDAFGDECWLVEPNE